MNDSSTRCPNNDSDLFSVFRVPQPIGYAELLLGLIDARKEQAIAPALTSANDLQFFEKGCRSFTRFAQRCARKRSPQDFDFFDARTARLDSVHGFGCGARHVFGCAA
jgi:hypothetical protein